MPRAASIYPVIMDAILRYPILIPLFLISPAISNAWLWSNNLTGPICTIVFTFEVFSPLGCQSVWRIHLGWCRRELTPRGPVFRCYFDGGWRKSSTLQRDQFLFSHTLDSQNNRLFLYFKCFIRGWIRVAICSHTSSPLDCCRRRFWKSRTVSLIYSLIFHVYAYGEFALTLSVATYDQGATLSTARFPTDGGRSGIKVSIYSSSLHLISELYFSWCGSWNRIRGYLAKGCLCVWRKYD